MLSQANLDMASARNFIGTFSGLATEEITSWICKANTTRALLNLDDNIMLRVTALQLRSAAQQWFCQTYLHKPNITYDEFCLNISERFSNSSYTHDLVSKFYTNEKINTRSKFDEKFNIATKLIFLKLLSAKVAINWMINCACENLKIFLASVKTECNEDWENFSTKILNGIWIVKFNNIENINSAQKYIYNKLHDYQHQNYIKNSVKKHFCSFHGLCMHTTKDCSKIKKQIKKTITSVKNKKKIKNEEKRKIEPEIQKINEKTLTTHANIMASKNTYKSLFRISGYSDQGKIECLIDTGAQCSILNIKQIPNSIKIKVLDQKVNLLSASGNNLNVIGIVKKFPIRINKLIYFLDAYVVKDVPKHAILGEDFIIKYPTILNSIINILKSQTNTKNLYADCITNLNITNLESKYNDLFATEITENKFCTVLKHDIQTTDDIPCREYNGRIPINQENIIDEEITKLKKNGIISPSNSEWNNRIVLVPKPDNSIRMCLDFRSLNAKTIANLYPIPSVNDILDKIGQAKYFSQIDATSGFYQIALTENSKHKTAFTWRNQKYHFNRMPFGLVNAPGIYQKIMNETFINEQKYILSYLDDTIIFSNTLEEHFLHLETAFAKLRAIGLSLNKKKCNLVKTEIKLLGNIIGNGIVKPDPAKIEAIKKYALPTNIKEMRSFLGFANYSRSFITNFASLTQPLYDQLKGETKRSIKKIIWNKQLDEAFSKIKEAIANITCRSQPDLNKPFILITDASDYAIGAILAQVDNKGKERMIYAFSKSLDKAQINYSTSEKECLAVIKGIEYFHHYLAGRRFKLRTDHKALSYIDNCIKKSSRLVRWSLDLQKYQFDIEYIPGESNSADGLSRISACSIDTKQESKLKFIDNTQEQQRIIAYYHMITGHGGNTTMKFNICTKYKWKGIAKDIEIYKKNCLICQKRDRPNINTKNKIIDSLHANDLWQADLIGYIPSEGKNKYILTAIDHYGKWLETKVLNNKKAETVTAALQSIIIDKHGSPKRLLTDNGLEFINKDLQNLCQRYNIQHITNSPTHHQTMGCIERANQTLMRKLKALNNYKNTDWESKVKTATYAVNISYNRAIGTSPYCFKMGSAPCIKIDQEYNLPITKISRLKLIENREKNFHKYATKHIIKGKKCCYDDYQVGDLVLIFREMQGNKLGTGWRANFRVKKILENGAYIVSNNKETLRTNKMHMRLQNSEEGDVEAV